MSVTYLRYLTENPYIKGYTLSAGDEIVTPEMSHGIVNVLETKLTYTGGGRTSYRQNVLIGDLKIPGIAQAATSANTDWCPVKVAFPVLIIAVSVHGEDANGNAAIAVGDTILYDTDGEMNNDVTNGTVFGIALNSVSSGATTVIPVLVLPFGVLANA